MDTFTKNYNEAMEMQQEFALDIYSDWWPDCEIVEPDQQESYLYKTMDFSGVDKIIIFSGGGMLHLPQRFRRVETGRDFTLRTSGSSGNSVEIDKLKTAYNRGMGFPEFYAFGRYSADKKSEGFIDFWLIRLKKLFNVWSDGNIEYEGPIPTHDDKEFIAFPVQNLIDEGLIEKQWESTA